MQQNYLNVKFVIALLEQIIQVFNVEEINIVSSAVNVSKWGVHNDYIYSEYLSCHFEAMLPSERKAIMDIVRTVINASAEAYDDLLTEGYLGYEENDTNCAKLDEFIKNLKSDENY